jgi:hypothetical protein
VPPVPAQIVDGAQALTPFGTPLVVSGTQQPVAHVAFDVHNGAHVPTPPPKSTQWVVFG